MEKLDEKEIKKRVKVIDDALLWWRNEVDGVTKNRLTKQYLGNNRNFAMVSVKEIEFIHKSYLGI